MMIDLIMELQIRETTIKNIEKLNEYKVECIKTFKSKEKIETIDKCINILVGEYNGSWKKFWNIS